MSDPTKICTNCGRIGHRASKCPLKPESQWAPWVQARLDAIEARRDNNAAWQKAERQWFEITMLFQRRIVVEHKRRPKLQETHHAAA